MLEKMTTFRIKFSDIEIIDGEFIKQASDNFLPEGHMYDPDFLYMKVRAVSAGEYWGPNKNADFFPEAELVKFYKTFLDAHAFKNHENKDVANAIGDVISAIWNDEMKYVELLIRIERSLAPTIVRGFEKGFMTDVSMGCKISHSICSKCGNIAKIPSQYCDHIKYQKHHVSDDGVRIYEINIGPKFHDISAVLSGADRTAKMTGLYIMGDKVAFTEWSEMSKTASMVDSFASEEFGPGNPFYKVASAKEIENFSINAIEFKMGDDTFSKVAGTKQGLMDKVAEIKKEIQAKIMSVARGDAMKTEGLDEVIDLFKMFYTEFLTREQCVEIGKKISSIARREQMPTSDVFNTLIGMLEVAGIELSSLEFDRITSQFMDGDGDSDCCSGADGFRPENYNGIKQESDDAISEFGMDGGLPAALKLLSIIRNAQHRGQPIPLSENQNMGTNMRVIISRINAPQPPIHNPLLGDEMMDMIRPMIPGRSMYRQHLIPRVLRISKMASTPNIRNLEHFIGPRILKTAAQKDLSYDAAGAASMYAYAQYQKLREKLAFSNWLDDEFAKYAHEFGAEGIVNEIDSLGSMEKVALLGKGYTVRKAMLIGAPLTFGYSAAQRARMRNGENVSGFNRYIAENPANAFMIQALMGPAAWKGGKALAAKLGGKAAVAGKNVGASPAVHNTKNVWRNSKLLADIKADPTLQRWHDFFTKYSEDSSYILTKEASEAFEHYDSTEGVDIFKNEQIDKTAMEKFSLTQVQVDSIKMSMIMECMEKSAASSGILRQNSLTRNDVSNFIKVCAEYLSGEVTKEAGDLKDVMMNTGSEMLFANHNLSMLPIMPGAVIDNVIFQGIFKALEKAGAKGKSKGEVATNLGQSAIKQIQQPAIPPIKP